MRILALSGWFPTPPDNGARIRTYALLRALAEAGHEVELIAFHRRPLPDATTLDLPCRLRAAIPYPGEAGAAWWHWLSPRPRSLRAGYSPAMARAVAQALAEVDYDRIVSFEIGPGTLTSHYVPRRYAARQVVEDLELWMLWGQVLNASSAGVRLRRRLMWAKAANYTRALVGRVRGCTVASEQEAALVRRLVPKARLAVVPNGVDAEACTPAPPEAVERSTLIFPGALTYAANFRAMRFFLAEVWPRVRALHPEARLRITGSTRGVDLAALPLDEGVELTGYVAQIHPLIARSTLCVVPILDGGGTRLKVLEAMACGTPVVATPKGAEGLAVRDGEHLLLAEGAEPFAAAVIRLLEDEALRRRLGEAGRALVVRRYDWRTIGATFEAFVRG